jgi:dihydrofolate reductase
MARELIVTENMTVDGVIDMSAGWFAPGGDAAEGEVDDVGEMREVEERLRADVDALLVGRTTFEAFRSYWPHQHDDRTGVADYLDRVQKYVVSTTMTDPAWEPTTILRGDVATEVAALKAGVGGAIVATGSLTLVPALIAADLVDEYRLMVYPYVAGEGPRLFEAPVARPRLELVESHPFSNGIVLLRYRAS